jgi:succinyl-CoA synthetase alpha subunit
LAILVDERSRIVIQGITGRVGREYAARMRAHYTPLVAGVTPGKGGLEVEGVPVFDRMRDAVAETGANTSLIVVPAAGVAEAAIEAVDAGIQLVVIYTEHVPVVDAMRLVEYARMVGTNVIGPNAAGVASPGKANVSDIDEAWLTPGRVGIVSRSGTMTYEVLDGLMRHNQGISTVACVGGDTIIGVQPAQAVQWFLEDDQTHVIVLLGEIGGSAELQVLELAGWNKKPIVACIAGQVAPPGKRLGHAGAIVQSANDSAQAKMKRLEEAGICVVPIITDVAEAAVGFLDKESGCEEIAPGVDAPRRTPGSTRARRG